MSVKTTETRSPEDINEGSWAVRFIGTHHNIGLIARRNWVELDRPSPFPGTKVYEAVVSITPGYTTLASAKKIIECGGEFTDVMPVMAWKVNDKHETIDTFTYPQFR